MIIRNPQNVFMQKSMPGEQYTFNEHCAISDPTTYH